MNVRFHQICASAYQLTFFKDESLSVNCYLVEEEDGLTLIDTAIAEACTEIVHAAAFIEKPITRIALTHSHHDHIGALDAIHQIFPDAVIHMSAREARLLAGDRTLDSDEPNTPIRGNIPSNIKARIDTFLHDGDRVGSLLSLATPGHTPGSMSYLDTRSQILFAGDAFVITGGIAVAGQLRPSFPFPTLGTWNKERSLESACKLLQYRPLYLAVGHGDTLENPYTDMNRAISEAVNNMGLSTK